MFSVLGSNILGHCSARAVGTRQGPCQHEPAARTGLTAPFWKMFWGVDASGWEKAFFQVIYLFICGLLIFKIISAPKGVVLNFPNAETL